MTKGEVEKAQRELSNIIDDAAKQASEQGVMLIYPEKKLAGWAARFGLHLVEDNIRLRKQIKRLKKSASSIG